jgi:hypothetical protein
VLSKTANAGLRTIVAYRPRAPKIIRKAMRIIVPLPPGSEMLRIVSTLHHQFFGEIMTGRLSEELRVPDRRELMAVIPAHCFDINERVAFTRLGFLLLLTLGFGVAAHLAVPKVWAFAPFWIIYAAVNGTIANGLWVLAHECGHHAFSRRKRLETAVGFILHSALLVPYFTWRKSHAWHHARTNHLTEDETHVPPTIDSTSGRVWMRIQRVTGRAFGPLLLATYLRMDCLRNGRWAINCREELDEPSLAIQIPVVSWHVESHLLDRWARRHDRPPRMVGIGEPRRVGGPGAHLRRTLSLCQCMGCHLHVVTSY